MSTRRRKDTQHLDDAHEHLRVLREHLSRGSLDDAVICPGEPRDTQVCQSVRGRSTR
jgi:hypothetical protein